MKTNINRFLDALFFGIGAVLMVVGTIGCVYETFFVQISRLFVVDLMFLFLGGALVQYRVEKREDK